MVLEYRKFEGKEDLDLQYYFWTEITKSLPMAWKPTSSPTQYFNDRDFLEDSRWFAFDDDSLVGYMSFTAQGKFVSLGYPWVLEGYKHIRDELWKRVFGAVQDKVQPEMVLQRFRSQWTDQIAYFQSKGFEIRGKRPIYGQDLVTTEIQSPDVSTARLAEDFELDRYIQYLVDMDWEKDAIEQMQTFFASVDFDGVVSSSKIQLGVTIREDTRFAEIIALPHYKRSVDYENALRKAAEFTKSKGGKILAITFSNHEQASWFEEFGFEHISDDVYVQLVPTLD